jgi:hypothetical protein
MPNSKMPLESVAIARLNGLGHLTGRNQKEVNAGNKRKKAEAAIAASAFSFLFSLPISCRRQGCRTG